MTRRSPTTWPTRSATGRIDPAHLLLAVTERDVADDVRQALTFSEAVRAIGVGICLDEHGSVADGVRYLSLIGAKRVKLTGQYVRGAKQSGSDRAMVGVLARAARELGIEVAAPFVTDDCDLRDPRRRRGRPGAGSTHRSRRPAHAAHRDVHVRVGAQSRWQVGQAGCLLAPAGDG